MRNEALHFRPEIDQNDREFALEAIHCLQDITGTQFSGFGNQPWFITEIPGEIYIKKEWEKKPFIKEIYLPNCLYVGPKHIVMPTIRGFEIDDQFDYEDTEISDDEFVRLRLEYKPHHKRL